MRTNVKGTNLVLNEQISDYLDKKLAAVTKLFDNSDATVCGVELARDTHHAKGEVFRAEITIEAPRGFFRASEEGESVYSAIDNAQEEILKELRRTKEKRVHLLRRGGQTLKEFTRSLGTTAGGVKRLWGRLRRRN